MVDKVSAVGVDSALRLLSADMEEDVDLLVDTMLMRMRTQVPDFDVEGRPELKGAEEASCYANVRSAISALGSDRQPPSSPPAEAIEEARVTARAGVPLESLVHTYRVGHAVVWEYTITHLEEMDLDSATRHAVLSIGSRYMFDFVDTVLVLVTSEYMAERDRIMRTGIQKRVQLVRDVLSGANLGRMDLGYDLEVEHIALIVDGSHIDDYLNELRRQTDRALLTVAMSDEVVWAWLGSREEAREGFWKSLAALPPPDGVVIALGSAGWGIDGFREGHAQAQAAHRIAKRTSQPLVRYADVALEATMMGDSDAARRFVTHELGPLSSEDERAQAHCATLEAYLGTGMNASSAAALLKVSDRTVAYRVRRIEDLLGRSVTSRSAEIAAALRLKRIYGNR